MTLRYTVLLTRETEPDAVVATVPALDLVTYGATVTEATAAAEEAITLELIGRAKHGEQILAEPSQFASLIEIEVRDISLDGVEGIVGFEAQIAATLTNALGQDDGAGETAIAKSGSTGAQTPLAPDAATRLSKVLAEFAAVWHVLETELDLVFPPDDPRRDILLQDVNYLLRPGDAGLEEILSGVRLESTPRLRRTG